MQFSWKGALLSPAIAPAIVAVLLVVLGLSRKQPLLGFLILFTGVVLSRTLSLCSPSYLLFGYFRALFE